MRPEHKSKQKLNVEVRRICNFLSLKVSYCVLMILLAITSVVQIICGGVVMTFLLLVVGIILPVFADRLRSVRKGPEQFVLTMLKKRYGYTDVMYQSLSNAFLVELLLLIIWQYASRRQVMDSYIISIMPVGFIFIFVFTRLVCYISYRLLIKYKLKYNYL